MKPIRLIPQNTDFPFVRLGKYAVLTSLVMMALSLVLCFFLGFNFGVDFKGGLLMQTSFQGSGSPPDVGQVRTLLSHAGLTQANIQALGKDSFIIKVNVSSKDPAESQETLAQLVKQTLGKEYRVDHKEFVGPQISRELVKNGLMAVALSILLMMIYVWFRFDWYFGAGAVMALFHDVLLTLGILSLTRYEVGLPTIAALLTIIGYSMNDTVVVFDRIRDNRRRYPASQWPVTINRSINETLSRTIMTSSTTLLSLIALFLFGGEAIASFVFTIAFGIIVGTYSSIFIASPVLLFWGEKK